MKKIVPITLIFLAFLWHSNANTTRHCKNFDLIELKPGIYACISHPDGKAVSNAGILDNGRFTIIFDDFLSPDAATELIELQSLLHLSPILYVVNSHYHNDHIRGNQVFADSVCILATAETAKLIASEEPLELKSELQYARPRFTYFDSLVSMFKGDTTSRQYIGYLMMRTYFEVLSQSSCIRTRLPSKLIDSVLVLKGPRFDVELISTGKGHTGSDLIALVRSQGVLFTGDLVFNGMHPYLPDGTPDKWKRNLSWLNLLPVNQVVPGHGEPGGKALIAATSEYITDLERIVIDNKSHGGKKEDLEKMIIPAKYQNWWLDIFFHPNLEFLFELGPSQEQ